MSEKRDQNKRQNGAPNLLMIPVRRTLVLAGLLLSVAIAISASPVNASSALWDKFGYTVTIHGTLTVFNPFDVTGGGNEIDIDDITKLDTLLERRKRLKQDIDQLKTKANSFDFKAHNKNVLARMTENYMKDDQKKIEYHNDVIDSSKLLLEIKKKELSTKEILEVSKSIETSQSEISKIKIKIKQKKEDIRNYDNDDKIYSAEAKRLKSVIAKSESRMTKLNTAIVRHRDKIGQHQTMAGPPPDADFPYRLDNMNWWVNTDLRHTDESDGARLIKGTMTGVMTGGDMKLGENSGIGFGIGYGHSDLTQTDPFGGANIDSKGVNLMTRGYWGPNSNLLFDASLSYGFARFKNVRSTFSDKYNTHALGVSFGANAARDFSPLWRGEARLGWSASHSIRKASTDTSGFYNNRLTSNFGKATLSGRLMRKFASGNGHIFADAALNAVTKDDSPANYDEQPFDEEIGAGFGVKLGGQAVLTGRGFIASLDRKNRDEYGGSLKIGFNF
jgi:hypothetical protein